MIASHGVIANQNIMSPQDDSGGAYPIYVSLCSQSIL